MAFKLNESGWSDELRHRAKGNERFRYELDRVETNLFRKSKSHEPALLPNITWRIVSALTEYVADELIRTVPFIHITKASMPLAVKKEIMTLVRQYLDQQLEKWLQLDHHPHSLPPSPRATYQAINMVIHLKQVSLYDATCLFCLPHPAQSWCLWFLDGKKQIGDPIQYTCLLVWTGFGARHCVHVRWKRQALWSSDSI